MSVNERINLNYINVNSNNQYTSHVETTSQKEDDLRANLDQLKQQKEVLLKQLQSIQFSINEVDQKIAKIEAKIKTEDESQITITSKKLEELAVSTKLAKPLIIIHKNEIVTSYDHPEKQTGAREHYSVSLLTKDNERIVINENWSLAQKYGKIKHIVISDGRKETELYDNLPAIKRLRKYLSTEFEKFRKELNKDQVDKNGYYPNKYNRFDCQRFSYFLQHGKEGTYSYNFNSRKEASYREANHSKLGFYSMKGYTSAFGSGGRYDTADSSVHYYMCLDDDVFVSKFGESDVLFTSYKQILTAYFPAKFTQGNHEMVW